MQFVYFVLLDVHLNGVYSLLPLLHSFVAAGPLLVSLVSQPGSDRLDSINRLDMLIVLLVDLADDRVSEFLPLVFCLLKILTDEKFDLFDFGEEVLAEINLLLVYVELCFSRVVSIIIKKRVLRLH